MGAPCDAHRARWAEAERRDAAEGLADGPPEARPRHADLFGLLREHDVAYEAWLKEDTRETRLALVASWHGDGGRIRHPSLGPGRASWPQDLRTPRCQAVVLERDDVDDPTRHHPYARGACLGCGWVGRVVEQTDEIDPWNTAAEDAHDHAWPEWRELPVLYRSPEVGYFDHRASAEFLDQARAVYPSGWIEDGGPILTWRAPNALRHHETRLHRGWDLGRLDPRFPTCPGCGHHDVPRGRYRGPGHPLPETGCPCPEATLLAEVRAARAASANRAAHASDALALWDDEAAATPEPPDLSL